MDKERIIALDVGDKRIGIAVSDPLGLTAQPVETYTRVGYGPDTRHIRAIADQYSTSTVLCGLPRNMDGTEGFQVGKVREFAEQLTKAGLSVLFYDERMTTVQAESALLEGGLSRQQRKGKVDMVAAVMILQSFLDAEAQRRRLSEKSATVPDEQEEDEQEDDIWTFDDENGQTVYLHLVYELDYEGVHYLFFNEEDDPDPDADFLVMSDNQDHYEAVEDEALLQCLYELYLKNSDQ